ncbi:hypothetical protein Tco_0604452 [Tanacetum coccineum]
MSDSEHSTATYTSISSDYEEPSDVGFPRVVVYGYDRLPMHPPSPDYVPVLSTHLHLLRSITTAVAVYPLFFFRLTGLYSESDPEEDPEEEDDEDLKEDPADYPTDRDDDDEEESFGDDADDKEEDECEDEEEEEHLALADSVPPP